jgi:hypothetical protein
MTIITHAFKNIYILVFFAKNMIRYVYYIISFFKKMTKLSKPLIIAICAIIIVGGGGVILAEKANAATPGTSLYPVDKLLESVTRTLTLNPEALVAFEQLVLDERLEELSAVTDNSDIALYLSEIEAQEEKLDLAIDKSGDSITEAKKEQIREQYQERIQIHIQTMEQVQQKLKNEQAQESVGKVIEHLQGKLTESQNEEVEQNLENNAGEDTQIQNQNHEFNTDNGNGSTSNGGNSGNSKGRN